MLDNKASREQVSSVCRDVMISQRCPTMTVHGCLVIHTTYFLVTESNIGSNEFPGKVERQAPNGRFRNARRDNYRSCNNYF